MENFKIPATVRTHCLGVWCCHPLSRTHSQIDTWNSLAAPENYVASLTRAYLISPCPSSGVYVLVAPATPHTPHTLHSVLCLGHMLQLASQSTLLLTFAVSWHSSSSFAKSLGWAGTAIGENIPQPPPLSLLLSHPLLTIEDCHTFHRLTTTFYSQNDKCLVCVCLILYMYVCLCASAAAAVVFRIFIFQALKWATCGKWENGQETVWPSTWRTLARLSNLPY